MNIQKTLFVFLSCMGQCVSKNLVLIGLISTNMSFVCSDTSKPGVTHSVQNYDTVWLAVIICLMYRGRFQSGRGYPSWYCRNQSECTVSLVTTAMFHKKHKNCWFWFHGDFKEVDRQALIVTPRQTGCPQFFPEKDQQIRWHCCLSYAVVLTGNVEQGGLIWNTSKSEHTIPVCAL